MAVCDSLEEARQIATDAAGKIQFLDDQGKNHAVFRKDIALKAVSKRCVVKFVEFLRLFWFI